MLIPRKLNRKDNTGQKKAFLRLARPVTGLPATFPSGSGGADSVTQAGTCTRTAGPVCFCSWGENACNQSSNWYIMCFLKIVKPYRMRENTELMGERPHSQGSMRAVGGPAVNAPYSSPHNGPSSPAVMKKNRVNVYMDGAWPVTESSVKVSC